MQVFMKEIVLAVYALLSVPLALHAGEPVEYRHGKTVFEGYLSAPDHIPARRPVPAVLICHAWRGIQDHERQVADALAASGVIAFVLDIYGKGNRPQNQKEAGKLSGTYKRNRQLLRERATIGLSFLRSMKNVDKKRIVAIGYCFGGTTVLELARSGADIAGAVSFHGGLDSPTPEDDTHIKAPILILHGAADPHVKREDITAMLKSFDNAGVTWTMVEFSNAVHAFTDKAAGNDPSRGAAYNERAADDSWRIFSGYYKKWTGINIE